MGELPPPPPLEEELLPCAVCYSSLPVSGNAHISIFQYSTLSKTSILSKILNITSPLTIELGSDTLCHECHGLISQIEECENNLWIITQKFLLKVKTSSFRKSKAKHRIKVKKKKIFDEPNLKTTDCKMVNVRINTYQAF